MNTDNVASEHHHHFAHHFESAEHEYESCKQGVWLFLVTEILMFGGLFVAFAIYHHMYPKVFRQGTSFLNWRLGALNTLVLITSSLTMALGVHYNKMRERKKAIINLSLTLGFGLMFLCIKAIEWTDDFSRGLFPGSHMAYHGVHVANLGTYFSFYFLMTGIHGIHVLIGMGLITWVLIRTIRGEFGPDYYTPVEGVGLFWHLIDLIWIFLFPILYLMG